MLIQPTLDALNRLKLHGMALALSEQMTTTAAQQLAFEERIALMIERGVSHRENSRMGRLWKACQPKERSAAIEDIDYRGRGARRAYDIVGRVRRRRRSQRQKGRSQQDDIALRSEHDLAAKAPGSVPKVSRRASVQVDDRIAEGVTMRVIFDRREQRLKRCTRVTLPFHGRGVQSKADDGEPTGAGHRGLSIIRIA